MVFNIVGISIQQKTQYWHHHQRRTFCLFQGTLIELQALTADNQVAQYKFDRSIDLNHFGLLWKIGLAGETEKFDWGITITTPSITLGNNGEYDYQEFLTDLPPEPYRYATSIQEPSVTYKRPFAIGGGISVPINRSQIHLSGEWYSSLDPLYAVGSRAPYKPNRREYHQFRPD
jgi:hypothetical protein